MRNCNIGVMTIENKKPIESEYVQCFVVNQNQSVSNEIVKMVTLFKEWIEKKNGNENEIISELRLLLNIPLPLHDIINPKNEFGLLLNQLMKSDNLVISTLAEMVLSKLKNEIKIGIQSGEYDRCYS